jgi:hypothetical protein
LPEDLWESDLEKDQGTIETRPIRTATEIEFLSGKRQWKDIKTISIYSASTPVTKL